MSEVSPVISGQFVVIRVEGAAPENAVEVLADAGQQFAVVPRDGLDKQQLSDSLPAIEITGTNAFELPTGALVLRWSGDRKRLSDALEEAGVSIIRDYGAGGVVAPRVHTNPFELAERLRKLDAINSAKVHTIRRASTR